MINCEIYKNIEQKSVYEKIRSWDVEAQKYPIGSERSAYVKTLPFIHVCDGVDHIKTRGNWGTDVFTGRCPRYTGVVSVQELQEKAPEKQKAMTFETFIDAFGEAQKVKNWINSDSGVLLLFGGFGSGKTHLAQAAQYVMVENGLSVEMIPAANMATLFHNAQPFRDDVQSRMDALRRINRLKSADCVIIDDLGVESNSQTFRENFQLLLDEMKGRLIITSNLSPYGTCDENGRSMERYQGRIHSRIMQGAVHVDLQGTDYRKKL